MNGIKIQLIKQLRSFLETAVSKRDKYFSKETDFSRSGKLGFAQTAVCCLFLLKKSLSLEIDEFYEILGKESETCTKSAFSQARYKINPVFFKEWQEAMSASYLSLRAQADSLENWHGLQVHALDGTAAYLFKKGDIAKTFGYQTNQHGVKIPMARIVVRYDVLHKVAISGLIEAYAKPEKVIAYELLEAANSSTISLYDRNFHSFAFMYAHQQRDLPFVMRGRCRENWLKDFIKTGLNTQIVTINAKDTDIEQAKKNFGFDLPKQASLKLRLIRVELANGEIEVLITNLLSEIDYPSQDFKALYALRWREETFFDVLKNKLQLEIFSGHCAQAIRQEFFALLLMASLQAVLVPNQEDLKPINDRRTYNYAINQAFSLGILKKLIPLLVLSSNFEPIIAKFERKCSNKLEPIRPNRNFQRTKFKQRLNGKFKTFSNFKRAV